MEKIMRYRRRIVVLLSSLSVCLISVAATFAEQDNSGQSVFQSIKSYEFGQSRQSAEAIEEQVQACLQNPGKRAELARSLARLLGGQATYACKQFVCRQLALIGTEEQVPALAELLTDEKLSHIALYALVHIDSPRARQAMREALEKTAGRVQIGIINALGYRGDKDSLNALTDLLFTGEPNVAGAAASALGRIAGPKAADALGRTLSQKTGRLSLVIADAYLCCGDAFSAQGQSEEARTIYRRLYYSQLPAMIRAASLKGLAHMAEPQEAVSLVLQGLNAADKPVRDAAGWLLRELAGAEVSRVLSERLTELSAAEQVLVLDALADRADKVALAALERSCGSQDAAVRAAALRAMGQLADAAAVPLLAKNAAALEESARQAARQSLRRLSGTGVDALMIAELDKAEPLVQVELIEALGDRAAAQAKDSMIRLAGQGEEMVQIAALRVLRDMGECADVANLTSLLTETDGTVRRQAESTVAVVAGRCPAGARTTSLLQKLTGVAEPDTRASLIRVLGQIGGPRALAAIRDALKDASPQVRLAAVRACSQWQNDAPLGDLWRIVKQSDSRQQRILALRGYIRLVGLNSSRPGQEAFKMYYKAMKSASGTMEKKMVLSGLSKVPTLATLELAGEYLNEPGLQQEAEAAVVNIAQTTCGNYPKRTYQLLREVLADSHSRTICEQARQIITQIDRFADYITGWEVSPAYSRSDAGCRELFDIAFAPESDSEAVNWRLMPAGTDSQQPWLLDLKRLLGGDNRVAYLRNRLWSDTEQKLLLELGSDDGIKVWLNGQVVYGNNVIRGIAPAQDKAELALRRGWNSLMLKVTQNVMGWGACARLCRPDGSAADGLCFDIQSRAFTANGLIDRTEKFGGYITTWEVAGAYSKAGAGCRELFDMVFAPEKNQGKGVHWQRQKVESYPGQAPVVNLTALLGGENRVAYLRSSIWSDRQRPVRLELGSDDGIKAWLNGRVVHANNTDRGCTPGQDKVKVNLQKGWNHLLLKITQGGGGWSACARVRDVDGSAAEGIRFADE